MAFFDIGINVNVNLGSSVNNVNTFISSMQRLGQVGAQPSQQVAQGFQRIQTSAASTQTTLQSLTGGMNSFQLTASEIQSRLGPATQSVQQLGLSAQNTLTPISNLGSVFKASLQPIQSGNAPLSNFNSQLGQMGQQFTTTERSGNRFAELFRGNRGLIFGLSATFGTITGVIFELQLMNEANKQVAESQAVINELIAKGREGSGQYQQAQQALGKDMRFLEFTTRNLALAFTNFIPDIILVITGILNLSAKLAANRIAQVEAGATAVVTATQIRSVGIASATSAIPLGSLAVAGRATGQGLTQAGIGARFFAGGIRSILISTGIGAALVLIGLALEPIISGFIKSREAAGELVPAFDSASQAANMLASEAAKSMDTLDTSTKSVVGSIVNEFERLEDKYIDLGDSLEKETQDMKKSGGVLDTLSEVFGLFTGKRTILREQFGPLPAKPQEPIEQFPQQGRAPTGREGDRIPGIPPGGQAARNKAAEALPELGSLVSQVVQQYAVPLSTSQASVIMRGTGENLMAGLQQAMAESRLPGGLFGFLPEQIELTPEMFAKAKSLAAEMDEILAKPEAEQDKTRFAILQKEFNDIVIGKDAVLNAIEGINEAQNKYNDILDSQPRLLQETGQAHKFLTPQLFLEQKILLESAAAYVDYGLAQAEAGTLTAQQTGLLKGIVAEGDRVVTGLYEQRDAIQGANIFWNDMNNVTRQQIEITQEQIISSIDITRALTEQTYQHYLLKEGIKQGMLAAQSWLDTAIQTAAAQKILYDETVRIVDGFMSLPEGIMFTTEQLQAMGEEFLRTGGMAEAKMEAMQQIFGETRAAVQELMNAAAEGGKEWREAWKDLDKSFIPKKERDETKEWIEDMVDVDDAVAQLSATMGLFQSQVDFGALDSKGFKRWSNEAKEGLRGVREEIEDLGPLGEELGPKIVQPFLDLFEDGLTDAELNLITQFTNEFQRIADIPGPITSEQLASLDMLGKKLLANNEAMEDAIEKAKDLGRLSFTPGGTGAQFRPDEPLTWEEANDPDNPANKVFDKTRDLTKGKDTEKGDPAKTFKTQVDAINAATQTAQTAMKNLAEQGSNSISILIKNIAPHVKTLDTYFRVTVPVAAQATQTSLANLSNEGVKSIVALIGVNNVYDQTVAQIMIDVGLWQGVNDDLIGSLEDVQEAVNDLIGENNILARTIVQVGNNLEDAADSAGEFEDALADLESQARQTRQELERLQDAGGGGGLQSAQGGFHTSRLDTDTIIMAHKGESVDIGPGVDRKRTTANGTSGDVTINLTVVTHNEMDGELIGTTVTQKTFRKLRTR